MPEKENRLLILGRWTAEGLNRILQESSKINAAGQRIDVLSRNLLGVDYKASTLIGDVNTPEIFVVNLDGMDCMTFIEYIEAMRLSGSFSEFIKNLKIVRYYQGKVAFGNRTHFFTDWMDLGFVEDVTTEIGGTKTIRVDKRLNLKKDGGYIIPGIPYKDREIGYIPSDAVAVDDAVMDRLNTGDYVGMYSKEDGLDVSHVGIVIKTGKQIYLRHASFLAGKVVDENFKEYIAKKEGLVILRPIVV
ncbi:MAG: hypothetical protein A2073_00615 [Deltaproteobacteria bacterium GWC2_42_11]|nr:MAG: hypothetical protein A2073_00615 [Deltaproteobacteria bacterium GWC2_42_11]HBO83891.1 DUF1460 domain-containing protein [Deltaproteobacteria bacterium]